MLEGNLSENWRGWVQRFDLYLTASGKIEENEKVQCAILLHTVKVKVKQPYLTSITRNSNSTDKPEVDGALILLPSLHQCSVLRVFKAT